jgi:uncharacterized protein
MKTHLLVLPLIFSLCASAVIGCVTVNVHFPESDVQRATDEFVRELYRAKTKGKTESGTEPAAAEPTAPESPASSAPPKDTSSLFDLLLPSAYADETTSLSAVHLDSVETKRIKGSMAERLEEILKYKRAGILGETNDGQLKIQGDPKLLKGVIQKLVQTENADRSALYSETVRSNTAAKLKQDTLKKGFAHSFQSESPSGTWVQEADGKWSQKP